MKKTGELRQPEGLNHTELMNVVSDGVREAMKDIPEPEPAPIEQANAALGLQPSPSDYLTQLNEMREAMTQIQQMFLATKQQDLQQPTMPQQSVQQHATKLTIFRQVTHPPNPQQPSTQVPIPPLEKRQNQSILQYHRFHTISRPLFRGWRQFRGWCQFRG